MRYLSEVAENWLLIFDNADDPSIALSKYFPTGDKGSILITSRNPESAVYSTVGSTRINTLSPEEAIDLLLKTAGVVDSDIATRESARRIVNTLDGLPLALVQVGAYIKSAGCSLERYMEIYDQRRRAFQHSPPIYRTIHLSLQRIEGRGTEVSLDALDLLYFFTFVSSDINAEELLERAWVNKMKHTQSSSSRHNQLRVLCNPMNVEWQPFRLRQALDLLASYSLISLKREDKLISIHPLIKTATHARLSEDGLLMYSNVTASILTAAAGMNLEAEGYGFREALLSHLDVFLSLHDNDFFASDVNVVDWAESLSSFSAAFRDGGQYERALELETRAMLLREQFLGGEHLDTLRSMNRISRHLHDLGRSQEAAAVGKRVFQTRQELLGIEHPETLESMECLASSYSMLGQLQEAIILMERALDLRRKLFGKADSRTITDMSHLAAYYRHSGRYLEALKLEEAVLFKKECILGQTHPDTLISMNNLAVTYGEIGRMQEATVLHEKVVLVSKQVLGDEHPSSATAMHNLAASYNKLGKHSEAVILEIRVLELRRGQFGKTHPDTLRAMANLATAYEAASQHQESLDLRQDLLQQTELIFGHDHPATLTVMADLATSREAIGRYQDAIKLREKLLQLAEVQFGRNHLTALKARSALATSYQITGQHQEAAKLRKALEQANESAGGHWQAEGLSATTNEAFSLSSTAETERCSSDSDSTCSMESSLSQAVSSSSATSSGTARATLVERITAAFENDLELVFAYEDLRLFMSRRKFIRKHMRLLKSYFKDLYPETVEQRQAVSFLSRSRQRRLVAELIYNRTPLNKKVVHEPEEAQNDLSRFDRLDLPVNSGEGSISPLAEEIETSNFRDQDQSSDESEDSDKAVSTEAHEISASALDGLMHSLTAGVPFEQYKTSLQKLASLRCSPQVLSSVMRLGNVDAMRGLLERHFEAVATKEFEWLQELRGLGYGFYDIAELLLDDMNKSPWVFLKQPEPLGVSIRPDFHTSNCVHQGGKKANLAPRLVTTILENTEDLRKIIAEHCGLAGVVPKSRDPKAWTGLVTFLDKGRSTASITYDIVDSRRDLVSRVCEALQRFCGIASYLQKKDLCCDSFTVLRFASVTGSTVIELRTIAFRLALDLYVVLQLLINNWESPGLISRCLPRLNEIANEIICTICDANIPDNKDDIEFQSCLDKVSLAVQILTLGIYLYSQAHCGAVHPLFLTNPLSHVYLLGIQSPHQFYAKAHIRVAPYRLTCMAGVAGDVVNVFGSPQFSEGLSTDRVYDLLASPANLAETWDAWRLIMDASMSYERGIYAIEVGEGFISAAGEISESRDLANTIPKLHWSRGEPSLDFKTPFSLHIKALIGTTAINTSCPVDEHRSWMCATVSMDTLGAKESYWECSEAQAGFQGGQYVIAQFNMAWIKRPGTTLKHIHLRPDINLPFLQSDWGLQISYCTGVARRVSLCDLLADITPILIEELLQQPPGWNNLRVNHNIVDALKGSDFKAWFDHLVPELQNDVLRIVRYVLLILQETGIDQSGDHLVAIWPRKGNPLGCFKIPCKDATYWARMLKDSSDCATFAYVTPLCLETNEWKCQKLQTALWHNRSVLLNTAVSLHKPGVAPVDQWRLRHEQSYVIGQPGNYLVGKVSISKSTTTIPPHLDISRSIIPASVQARIKEHLREKQCTNAPAHGVIVVARHPQLFSLGFQ